MVNEYALHFIVPVAANVRDIAFTWQSLAGRPVNLFLMFFYFFQMGNKKFRLIKIKIFHDWTRVYA